MSLKIKRRLSRFADGLEAVVRISIESFALSVHLFMIDLVWGKGKYRKHGPKMRPIIHRTYVRNITVREPIGRRQRANDLMNRRG